MPHWRFYMTLCAGLSVIACATPATTPQGSPQTAPPATPAATPESPPTQGATGRSSVGIRAAAPPRQQAPEAEPTATGEPKALAGMTEAHNQVRKRVGVAPLQWSNELAAYATQWANHLKQRNCALDHRPLRGQFAQKYGENLFLISGAHASASEVVEAWASEAADYNYKKNSCKGMCGHYTQVVWRDTQEVGCALATCGSTEVWVCNYNPPGNFMGKRPY